MVSQSASTPCLLSPCSPSIPGHVLAPLLPSQGPCLPHPLQPRCHSRKAPACQAPAVGGTTRRMVLVWFGHQIRDVTSAEIWASSWKAGPAYHSQALQVSVHSLAAPTQPLPGAFPTHLPFSPPSLCRRPWESHFSTLSFHLLSAQWDYLCIELSVSLQGFKEKTDMAFTGVSASEDTCRQHPYSPTCPLPTSRQSPYPVDVIPKQCGLLVSF